LPPALGFGLGASGGSSAIHVAPLSWRPAGAAGRVDQHQHAGHSRRRNWRRLPSPAAIGLIAPLQRAEAGRQGRWRIGEQQQQVRRPVSVGDCAGRARALP
jgi:hypothetical protein